jgi:Glutamine amidotransferase domain
VRHQLYCGTGEADRGAAKHSQSRVSPKYGIEDQTPRANGSVLMNESVFLPTRSQYSEKHAESRPIALGHVRLEINDLSSAGAQPFSDADDDLHAVVNGRLRLSPPFKQGVDSLQERSTIKKNFVPK